MRVLVTGATGFAGSHLTEALLTQENVQILGMNRRAPWPPHSRHLEKQAALQVCDLCDGAAVEAVLRDFQPERIYHLAGYANVGRSFHEVEAVWAGNLTATRTLYEAVHRWGGRPRILYVGSGLIYGDPERPDQAFDETSLPRPTNAYAASKAAADLVSYQYTRTPGLEILRVRPYNHIGPRQSPQYAIAHFAQQIVAIERGQKPPILETGNLNTRRDLTDVRDMVRAYMLLMEHGRSGEAYNAGTGELHVIGDVLQRLLKLSGVQVELRQRPDLLRAADTAAVRAEASKLRRETGWTPRFTLDQTLTDTLEYWRQQP